MFSCEQKCKLYAFGENAVECMTRCPSQTRRSLMMLSAVLKDIESSLIACSQAIKVLIIITLIITGAKIYKKMNTRNINAY